MLVSLIFASDYDCLAHRRMISQSRFNLAQLDAEAANLNLIIDTPDELDLACRPIANQVARLVKTGIGLARKRIANKSFGV